MSGRLAGRRAIVTGAGGGIGAAIALAYAREGAAVGLVDIAASDTLAGVEADCAACGVPVITALGDLADAAAAGLALGECEAGLGRVDVLVCAAGIGRLAPVEAMTVDEWDEMIAADLRSVFLSVKAVLDGMLTRGDGRIIAVSSQLAIKGGAEMAHYAAAKAGVIGFIKSLALEVSARGVLANVIAPGPIETPLLAGLSEEWRAAKRLELPLGRFGRPEEVAPTAVLLAASPDGDLYTGQTLGPNSGDVMP